MIIHTHLRVPPTLATALGIKPVMLSCLRARHPISEYRDSYPSREKWQYIRRKIPIYTQVETHKYDSRKYTKRPVRHLLEHIS